MPAAIIISSGVTYSRYRVQYPASAEPFAFYDGISIWPGDFVRLFVLLLAIHFVAKTLVGLERDALKLAEDFGLEAIRSIPGQQIGRLNCHQRLVAHWNKLWPHGQPSPMSGLVDVHTLSSRYRDWVTPHW